MKNFYKLIIIFGIVLLLGILSIYFIPSQKNFFAFKIKSAIPSSVKNLLKSSVFIVPEQKKEIELLKKKYNNLEAEYNLLKKELAQNKFDNINNYKLEKIKIPFYNREKSQKSVAFLELYKSKIITVSGTGNFLYSTNFNKLSSLDFKKIETNLFELISDKNFFDTEQKEPKGQMISIKDTLIIDDEIYLSYSKLVDRESNCYNLSILKANISFNKLNFENFFDKLKCIENPDGYHTGGRMVFENFSNSMLLTTADMGSPILAQTDKSFYGKILRINLDNKKIEIISKGHRNPQGLTLIENSNLIISTEHGPIGGDEVNLITKGKNYGWPIASYGESDIDHLKSHKDNNFVEPLIYFTPSIGISEILHINNVNSNLNNKFILTSLKGNHNGGQLYILEYLKDQDKMKILNQITIGERIRDIKYSHEKDRLYLALENSPAIGELDFNNNK